MQLPVEQFPVLTSGQMSPFHQALQSGLANYQNMLKTSYMPYQLQADVASKQAYAQNLGRQIAGSVLSNPLAIATMNNDQRNALLQQLTNGPSQMGIPLPGQGGLFSSGQSQQAPQQNNNPYGLNPQDLVNNGGNQSPPSQDFGANNRASDAMVNDIANNGNGAYNNNSQSSGKMPDTSYVDQSTGIDLSDPSMNLYNRDFGSPQANAAVAKQYPSPKQQIMFEQKKSSASETGKNQSDALQQMNDDAYAEGKDAASLLAYTTKAQRAYNDAFLKGPLLSLPGGQTIAKFDPNTYEAMTDTNNVVIAKAGQLFGNKQSDYRDKLVAASKLSVDMPKQAFNNAIAIQNAMAQRMSEHLGFNIKAAQYGISDPNVIKKYWIDYQAAKPIYDIKTNQIAPQNLNSYDDYLKKIMSGQSQNVSNQGSKSSNQNDQSYYTPSPRAVSLSKTLKMPNFNTKEQFQSWFNDQDQDTQDAVSINLRNQ